jgi:hypothetical protein
MQRRSELSRLNGGGCSHERTLLRLYQGKNQGNITLLASLPHGWLAGSVPDVQRAPDTGAGRRAQRARAGTSSSQEGTWISRLKARPARSSVNASPASSRTPTHDSRPLWVATQRMKLSFTTPCRF